MVRTLVDASFAGHVKVKVENEQILLGAPARVSIYEGDKLIVEIFVKTEQQKGADGKLYDVATFIHSYPAAPLKEVGKEASDDQKKREG